MDLLSSIRKSGSRGGVNFSWDEVSTSQHRENYLGHSLMAPVGRWQKGRDLNWYAKGDDASTKEGETVEEKKIRERKEEIKRIKEAEEDALSRALGLPVKDRTEGGQGTGSNALGVGELRRVIREAEEGDEEIEEVGRGKGFGDFVGKVEGEGEASVAQDEDPERGGLVGWHAKKEKRSASKERKRRRHRHRSRSGERHRHRSRSGDRHRHRRRYDDREDRREGGDRRERRHRSRSPERRRPGRNDWESRRDDPRRDEPRRNEPRREGLREDFRYDRPGRDEPRQDTDRRPQRSRSPDFRDRINRREIDRGL